MILNSNFILKEIPKFHPLSIQYDRFWKEEKRKCIEGAWAHGKFMPPKLYFYINHYTILLNKDLFSKQKIYSTPRLRDIEWGVFYNIMEARGFSGFANDDQYTCFRKVESVTDESEMEQLQMQYPNIVSSSGRLKKYVPARDYLRKTHKTNMGKPLYENESLDFMWLTARGVGKSYITSAVVLHEWLFDGLTDYDDYLLHHEYVNRTGREEEREKFKVSLLVGAADAKYTKQTLSKAKEALERLPGGQTINKIYHPSPFFKQWKGSWDVGGEVIAEYKKKEGGDWKDKGSKSTIKNRSFRDNPFAGQGDRNTIMLLEEIGMFPRLIESRNALEENMKHSGTYKFGTAIMIGTGGDMHGGGCVVAGTKVWDTIGNLHNIEDLPQDKGIIGFNQILQKESKEEITYWQEYKEKDCWKITTNTGRTLEASWDHPILYSKHSNFRNSKIINGKKTYSKKVDWIPMNKLEVGFQVATIGEIDIFSNILLKDARLIGLLIGDGNYSDTPVLSNCDEDINLFVELNYKTITQKKYVTKDNQIYKENRILGIRNYLKELGILKQTKLNKTLPLNIHRYSKESITQLLGGFFDADGSVNNKRIELSSMSKSLLDEVLLILQKLGIHANINKRIPNLETNKNKRIKSVNNWYNLCIDDKRSIIKFYENIYFISKRKQSKLIKLIEICKKRKNLFSKELSGLRFERIVSIEYTGIKQVYNLTADTTNTYVANGIVTHNTWDANRMFYDPKTYNLVSFDDEWEHRGKIAYFTPAYYGLNHFKDSEGNTNIERAKKELVAEREKLMDSKSGRGALDNLIQYQPLVPSEVFLTKQGNIFPISELRDRLAKLETHHITSYMEKKVQLYFDETNKSGVNYKIDVRNDLTAINQFPWPDQDNREGCVVIYELPILDENGNIPKDLYIIGHDPYRSDSAEGGSLSATIVMKTKKHFAKYSHDEIVAVYYGRPYQGRQVVNENLLKLGMFYNAKIYFENNVGNVKEYFEKMKRLDLLAKRPQTVLTKTASFIKGEVTEYGYPISNDKFKMEAINYVRDWLLEERGRYSEKIEITVKDKRGKTKITTKEVITEEGEDTTKIVRNLDKLWDKYLIQELIMFNMDGNFDAVMSLCACVIGLEENYNKYKEELHTFADVNKMNFLINNPKIFPRSAEIDPKNINNFWK